MNQAKAQISTVGLIDWPVVASVLLAALIVLPRSISIARAHSETYDAQYHITRGLAYLTRTIAPKDIYLNDPPLGEGLVALPILVTNLLDGRAADDDRLYDTPGRAETIAVRVAAWNAVFFLPLVATVFVWCRRLYGCAPAWLATAILVVEPNFAAHIPAAALDVIGVTGIVIACFCMWRYFESPSPRRLVALGAATGAALMIKHTAVILPVVICISAALCWVIKPWLTSVPWIEWRAAIPGRIRALALIGLTTGVAIWVFTLFELCPPMSKGTVRESLSFLTAPWPAGSYVRAFRNGMYRSAKGHGYLFGEVRTTGWWYYFPVVATYKVPIGIGVVLALGVISLWRMPPRWEEWGLILPLAAWVLLLMNTRVNIGYRHFLPAYTFALIFASRSVSRAGLAWLSACWIATAVAGLHALTYHPDYLCYFNFSRDKPYLAISDNNVDWSQGLKQLRDYLDSHPHGAKVWFLGIGPKHVRWAEYYLGDRVTVLRPDEPRPTTGLLAISPVYVAGVYNMAAGYAILGTHTPDAVVGHSLLIYDLDRLNE